MPLRSSAPQYALLAVVAILALLHAFGGAAGDLNNLNEGTSTSQFPFSVRSGEPVVSAVTADAARSGLDRGDLILSINGVPFRGFLTYLDQVRRTPPGTGFDVTFVHPPKGAKHPTAMAFQGAEKRSVRIHSVGYEAKPLWAASLQVILFFVPFFCLLTGLYVVFARPRNIHAWLIFGILAYSDAIFFPPPFMPHRLVVMSTIWGNLVQTLMPVCLMFFAITFPDRSAVDVRLPWLKWVLAVPLLFLYPVNLFSSLSSLYDYAASAPLARFDSFFGGFETLLSVLAITLFFFCLVTRIRTSTGDARRRLRILYAGATFGLTPFLILLVISIVRNVEFDQAVPRWIFLIAVVCLLFLPLSLAYVVVVQRAMDLRILIRQGTKYFFARHTLTVIRVLLTVWMAVELKYFLGNPAHPRAVDVARMLGIVALFFAFRFALSKRLQQGIDQRFFREAYSSEQILSDLSEEARNFTETDPLLDTITRRIGSTLHVERIAVFLRSGDSFRLELAMGLPLPVAGSGALETLTLPSTSATIATLSRAKEPALIRRDDPTSWLVDATDAERLALKDLSTELLVPLPGRNRLIGVMALGPKLSEEPYSSTDRHLLQTVAAQAGLALENAELLETLTAETAQRERISREIEIAREVQQRLFPQTYPTIEGIDMAGFCRPAQAVGGDYYDLFLLGHGETSGAWNSGRLALAIGDISGKGISAALLMASLRASLRSLARLQEESGAPDLAGLMHHVNDLVYEASAANRYATFFFAELDPHTRRLTYVNAGHNPPVILRGSETIELPATGMVVGLLPEATYTQAEIELTPGDVLLAFTDGISEAMTIGEEEWGEDRMIAAAHALLAQTECTYTAEKMITCLMEQADSFTAGAPQNDDMTLLICRLLR